MRSLKYLPALLPFVSVGAFAEPEKDVWVVVTKTNTITVCPITEWLTCDNDISTFPPGSSTSKRPDHVTTTSGHAGDGTTTSHDGHGGHGPSSTSSASSTTSHGGPHDGTTSTTSGSPQDVTSSTTTSQGPHDGTSSTTTSQGPYDGTTSTTSGSPHDGTSSTTTSQGPYDGTTSTTSGSPHDVTSSTTTSADGGPHDGTTTSTTTHTTSDLGPDGTTTTASSTSMTTTTHTTSGIGYNGTTTTSGSTTTMSTTSFYGNISTSTTTSFATTTTPINSTSTCGNTTHTATSLPEPGCNTPNSRSSWCGASVKYDTHVPYSSGETKHFELTITNTTSQFDGLTKLDFAINGQTPGPLIELNWGDTAIITVTNALQDNATTIHWHGIRQTGSNDQDGVPGVSECGIAPGSSRTYTWKATTFGTGWYHGHTMAQFGGGVRGPLIVHGPSTADYDLDLGHIMIDDVYSAPMMEIAARAARFPGPPPVATNYLLNGKNKSPDGTKGENAKWILKEGKKHLIRIINR